MTNGKRVAANQSGHGNVTRNKFDDFIVSSSISFIYRLCGADDDDLPYFQLRPQWTQSNAAQ